MIDPVERIARLSPAQQRAIGIVAGIWFWTGMAIQARFIRLPDFPEWLTESYFWLSVAVNAVWWGFIFPKVQQRRKEIAALERSTPGQRIGDTK